MKFIKFDWKMWFFACGLASVMIVIIGITNLRQSLLEVYIYLFVFNFFSTSLNWVYGRLGKMRGYIVIYGIALVLLFIQRTIIDIVRNDAIHWIRNLILAIMAIGVAGIVLAVYEWIMYLRTKNMNRKLKEYQEKNKD